MSKRAGVFIIFVFRQTGELECREPQWEDCKAHYKLYVWPADANFIVLKTAIQKIIRYHPWPVDGISAIFDESLETLADLSREVVLDFVAIALKAFDSAAKREPIEFVRIRLWPLEAKDVWNLICTLPARIVCLHITTAATMNGDMPARVFRRMKNLRELMCIHDGNVVKIYSCV